MIINMINVQRQINGCDCGVFAIANATELAFGKDPLLCQYDTEVMRLHFLKCLENRKMKRFPLKQVANALLVAGSTLTFWIPSFASTSSYSSIFQSARLLV